MWALIFLSTSLLFFNITNNFKWHALSNVLNLWVDGPIFSKYSLIFTLLVAKIWWNTGISADNCNTVPVAYLRSQDQIIHQSESKILIHSCSIPNSKWSCPVNKSTVNFFINKWKMVSYDRFNLFYLFILHLFLAKTASLGWSVSLAMTVFGFALRFRIWWK